MQRNTRLLLRKRNIKERSGRRSMSTYRQATSTVMAFGDGEVLKAIWDLELNICTFPRPSTCTSQVYIFTRKSPPCS